MELLEILGLICALVGVAGCVVPILPGTPICFVGMFIHSFSKATIYGS